MDRRLVGLKPEYKLKLRKNDYSKIPMVKAFRKEKSRAEAALQRLKNDKEDLKLISTRSDEIQKFKTEQSQIKFVKQHINDLLSRFMSLTYFESSYDKLMGIVEQQFSKLKDHNKETLRKFGEDIIRNNWKSITLQERSNELKKSKRNALSDEDSFSTKGDEWNQLDSEDH